MTNKPFQLVRPAPGFPGADFFELAQNPAFRKGFSKAFAGSRDKIQAQAAPGLNLDGQDQIPLWMRIMGQTPIELGGEMPPPSPEAAERATYLLSMPEEASAEYARRVGSLGIPNQFGQLVGGYEYSPPTAGPAPGQTPFQYLEALAAIERERPEGFPFEKLITQSITSPWNILELAPGGMLGGPMEELARAAARGAGRFGRAAPGLGQEAVRRFTPQARRLLAEEAGNLRIPREPDWLRAGSEEAWQRRMIEELPEDVLREYEEGILPPPDIEEAARTGYEADQVTLGRIEEEIASLNEFRKERPELHGLTQFVNRKTGELGSISTSSYEKLTGRRWPGGARKSIAWHEGVFDELAQEMGYQNDVALKLAIEDAYRTNQRIRELRGQAGALQRSLAAAEEMPGFMQPQFTVQAGLPGMLPEQAAQMEMLQEYGRKPGTGAGMAGRRERLIEPPTPPPEQLPGQMELPPAAAAPPPQVPPGPPREPPAGGPPGREPPIPPEGTPLEPEPPMRPEGTGLGPQPSEIPLQLTLRGPRAPERMAPALGRGRQQPLGLEPVEIPPAGGTQGLLGERRMRMRKPIWADNPDIQPRTLDELFPEAGRGGEGLGPPRERPPSGWEPTGREPGGPHRMKPLEPSDEYAKLQGALTSEVKPLRGQVSDLLKSFWTNWIDRVYPLQRVELETAGRFKPYSLARLVPGMQTRGDAIFVRHYIPILESVGRNLAELEEYMVLQRAKDILGINPEARLPGGLKRWAGIIEAEDKLRSRLGQAGFVKLQRAADALYNLNFKWDLGALLEEGMLSKDQYMAMKTRHPHYIDFQRDIYDIAPAKGVIRTGQPASVSDLGIERMADTGSDLALSKPLTRLVQGMWDTQYRIQRNRAAKDLFHGLRDIERQTGETLINLGESARSKDFGPISFFEDGQKVIAQVPRDLADAARGMDAQSTNVLVNVLETMAAPLRWGATGYNLLFTPTNLIRDMKTAMSMEGFGMPVTYWQGVAAAISKNPDFYQAAMEGALHSGFVESFRRTKNIAQASAHMGRLSFGSWKDAAKALPRLVENINVMAEQTPRIGLHQKLRKMGVEWPERAVRARDVTVDFSKAGNIGKVVNQIIPFFNAAIQGTVNLGRAAQRSPTRFAVLAGMFGAGEILVWLWNQRFESANMVPDYELGNYNTIVIGEGVQNPDPSKPGMEPERFPIYIRIPKGQIGAIMAMPFLTMLKMAWEQNDRSVIENVLWGAGSALQQAAPIDIGMSGFMPPLLATGTSLQANYDFWRGTPIIPERERNLPPEYQYGPDTSTVAVQVGRMFGVSPRKIDFAIKDYTAGLGKQALWLTDVALGALGITKETFAESKQRIPTQWEEASYNPFIGRFLGTRNVAQEQAGWDRFNKALDQGRRKLLEIPEIARLGVNMGQVGDKIGPMSLTPSERALYQQEAANVMIPMISELIAKPAFQNKPDEGKRKIIQALMDRAREIARARVLPQIKAGREGAKAKIAPGSLPRLTGEPPAQQPVRSLKPGQLPRLTGVR